MSGGVEKKLSQLGWDCRLFLLLCLDMSINMSQWMRRTATKSVLFQTLLNGTCPVDTAVSQKPAEPLSSVAETYSMKIGINVYFSLYWHIIFKRAWFVTRISASMRWFGDDKSSFFEVGDLGGYCWCLFIIWWCTRNGRVRSIWKPSRSRWFLDQTSSYQAGSQRLETILWLRHWDVHNRILTMQCTTAGKRTADRLVLIHKYVKCDEWCIYCDSQHISHLSVSVKSLFEIRTPSSVFPCHGEACFTLNKLARPLYCRFMCGEAVRHVYTVKRVDDGGAQWLVCTVGRAVRCRLSRFGSGTKWRVGSQSPQTGFILCMSAHLEMYWLRLLLSDSGSQSVSYIASQYQPVQLYFRTSVLVSTVYLSFGSFSVQLPLYASASFHQDVFDNSIESNFSASVIIKMQSVFSHCTCDLPGLLV